MATQVILLKFGPKNFFQPQIEFRTQTNIFRKFFFCMQNLMFIYALINVW